MAKMKCMFTDSLECIMHNNRSGDVGKTMCQGF